MEVFTYIAFVMGALSFMYLFLIMAYAGLSASFLNFWLLSGIFLFGISAFLHALHKQVILIPLWAQVILGVAFIIGASIFIFIGRILFLKGHTKPTKQADYMIVLWAQIKKQKVSKSLRYRLDVAAEYLKKSEKTLVIVSGGKGKGEDISEAEAMSAYLEAKGILKERIIEEKQSTNTNENILYSKNFIETLEANVLIVSNDFHIYRATSIAKKKGFSKVEGLGAKTDQVLWINYYMREIFAVMKDIFLRNM